jgi:hypothetical protein
MHKIIKAFKVKLKQCKKPTKIAKNLSLFTPEISFTRLSERKKVNLMSIEVLLKESSESFRGLNITEPEFSSFFLSNQTMGRI